jgi:hypothetical protein
MCIARHTNNRNVMPAEAETHASLLNAQRSVAWVPTCVGMTLENDERS